MKRESSALLIDEDPLQVLPSLAVAIGLNEAIALQQLHYWLKRSENIRSDRVWVYNSYDGWAEYFPFWSYRTIQRAFLSLEEKGLIITETPGGQDRRKWYTIDYASLNNLSIQPKPRKVKQPSPTPESPTSDNAKVARSIRQDGIIGHGHSGTLNMPERHDVNKVSEITTETTKKPLPTAETPTASRKSKPPPALSKLPEKERNILETWRATTKRYPIESTWPYILSRLKDNFDPARLRRCGGAYIANNGIGQKHVAGICDWYIENLTEPRSERNGNGKSTGNHQKSQPERGSVSESARELSEYLGLGRTASRSD